MKEDYVHTVLRKDGTVVTITPTNGLYDVAVEDKHRTVGPEVTVNPLHDPEFDAIVRELKKDLEPRPSALICADRRRRKH